MNKKDIIQALMTVYQITEKEALFAISTCLYYGFYVVKPKSKEHPHGVVLTCNSYREITIKT